MPQASEPHLSIIIPAYNEEQRLPYTLEWVLTYLARQEYRAELIVVDDGCVDGTAAVVHDRARLSPLPIRLLQHPDRRNLGKGAAVARGMLAARGRFRLFMDADHAIGIHHLDRFWPFFEEGYSVVIGTRDTHGLAGGGVSSLYRRSAARVGSLIIRALAAPGLSDTQTGFKMFTAPCVADVFPRLTIAGWGFDVEVLAVCRRLGHAIKEVGVEARNQPDSKVKVRAYIDVLREVWRVRRNLRRGLYNEIPAVEHRERGGGTSRRRQ